MLTPFELSKAFQDEIFNLTSPVFASDSQGYTVRTSLIVVKRGAETSWKGLK